MTDLQVREVVLYRWLRAHDLERISMNFYELRKIIKGHKLRKADIKVNGEQPHINIKVNQDGEITIDFIEHLPLYDHD